MYHRLPCSMHIFHWEEFFCSIWDALLDQVRISPLSKNLLRKADVVARGSFTGFTLIPSSKTRIHLFRISDHVYPAAALHP